MLPTLCKEKDDLRKSHFDFFDVNANLCKGHEMFEHSYYTFWFYQSDSKAIGLALTNRGPKLMFETRSQTTMAHAEESDETA